MEFRCWSPQRIEQALIGHLDVNLIDSRGFSALHWCIWKNRLDLFESMIMAGTSVDAATEHLLLSPLHVAVEMPTTDFTQTLLRHRANPNAQDNRRRTPIHIAADVGATDHILLLLASGADTSLTDLYDQTPLDTALSRPQIAAARLLFGLPGTELKSLEDRLLAAVEFQRSDSVEFLLKIGANPATRSGNGESLLDLASRLPFDMELDCLSEEEFARLQAEQKRTIELLNEAFTQQRGEQDGGGQPATRPESK